VINLSRAGTVYFWFRMLFLNRILNRLKLVQNATCEQLYEPKKIITKLSFVSKKKTARKT